MVTITGGKAFEAALKKIAAKVTKAASVEIGYPAGSTHTSPDGKTASLPLIAAVQEFGAPSKGIPPRPFMRNAVAQHSGEWPAVLIAALKASDGDSAKALGMLGGQIAAEIQQSIVDMTAPALSPVTVMLRGMRSEPQYRDLPFHELFKIAAARVSAGKTTYGASSKPLVDSGQLLQGVVFMVKEG